MNFNNHMNRKIEELNLIEDLEGYSVQARNFVNNLIFESPNGLIEIIIFASKDTLDSRNTHVLKISRNDSSFMIYDNQEDALTKAYKYVGLLLKGTKGEVSLNLRNNEDKKFKLSFWSFENGFVTALTAPTIESSELLRFYVDAFNETMSIEIQEAKIFDFYDTSTKITITLGTGNDS